MTNEEAKILLDRYNQGLASPAEVALLQYWFIHEASRADAAMSDNELQQIVAGMRKEVIAQTKLNRSLWPRIARIGIAWKVAAAVAAIVFGVWFYNAHYTNGRQVGGRHPELVSGSHDIAPGKNTATLTLANGKTITLSDAKTGVVVNANEMKYNDGSLVQGASGTHFSGSLKGDQKNTGPVNAPSLGVNEMLTASTPRGGTYQFTLPDGTQVWLNAASKISFPAQFSSATRKILLINGEAYFEVAKNKQKPFIVESNGQQVTVLGTHFNINAYNDEKSTKTTLLEGAVKVSTTLLSPPGRDARRAERGEDVILTPGQQATNTNTTLTVKAVDTEEAVAWKAGYFKFKNETLESIMHKISRWYNVDVVFENESLRDITFGGRVSRFDQVSSILKMLQLTKQVNFKIEGRKIYISKI